MTSERISTLLIITLLVANLGLSVFIAFRPSPTATVASSKEAATSEIATGEANKMAEGLVVLYNDRNIDAIYDQFDPLAKIQITKEQLATQMEKLVTLIGRIENCAYSHSTVAGNQGGRTYYVLHYKVRLSSSSLPNGDMTITVSRKPEGLSLFGFFINGTTNQQGQ